MKKRKYRIVIAIFFLLSVVGILIGNYIGSNVSNVSNEKKARELFLEGEKFFNKGNYENALYAFRLIVENYPQIDLAARAAYEMGKIYEYHLKDFKQAINCYQKIIKSYPASAYFNKAQYKLQTHISFGHKWYKGVIKSYPESSPLNITLYHLISQPENIDDLLKDIELLIEGYRKWEDLPRLMLLQSQLLSYKGDLSTASQKLQELIEILPQNPLRDLTTIELANVYYKKGDYLKSKKILEKIKNKSLSSDANSLIFYYGLGEINFVLSQYNQAIWYYQKIAYNFDWQKAQEVYFNYFSEIMPELKLGECYQNNNEYQIAQSVYHQFLEKNIISEGESLSPNTEKFYYGQINRALFFLGNCYERKGDIISALKNYKKIKFVSPDMMDKEQIVVQALVKIGNIYSILGKFDAAIPYFEYLVNNYPQSRYVGKAWYSLGRIKEEKGEEVDASYYEKIIQNYPESPDLPLVYYQFIRKRQKILAKNNPLIYILYKEEERIARKYGNKVREVIGVDQDSNYYSQASVHLILGDIYFYQRKYDRARKEFQSISYFKSKNKEISRGWTIISTLTPKDRDLKKRIEECKLKKNIFLSIQKWKKDLNSDPLNSQAYYHLSSAYQELGWIEDSHKYFWRGLRIEPQAGKIHYLKEIKKIVAEVKEKNALLVSKLELLLERDNQYEVSELKELKKFADTHRERLLIILANLNWGLTEKVGGTQTELEKELKRKITQDIWQVIQNNYITIIPPDINFRKIQSKFLNDIRSLYDTYSQVAEAVDIHFISGMDIKPIWQDKKEDLIRFNAESLKNWETILANKSVTIGEENE